MEKFKNHLLVAMGFILFTANLEDTVGVTGGIEQTMRNKRESSSCARS